MDIMEAMVQRHSVRRYKEIPIEDEKIQQIRAAINEINAQTGLNIQLITNEPDFTLLVFYADCVPVIIADPKTKSACAVHSGWRGTKENIAIKAIEKMVNNGSDKKDLMAVIGPAIGLCHFEVSENVYMEFANSPYNEFAIEKDDKFYIDLKKTVEKQIINSGVLKENVAISDICTFCDNEMYSYRREGENAGRMAAFIKTPK